MTDMFDGPGVIVTRDQWDRPIIIPPDGGDPEPYTRASTFCSALSDSTGIGKWKARHVALGVGKHEDLAAMAAGLEYGDKQLDEIVETAIDRSGCNAKANWGTAMHTFTERDTPTDMVPQRMRDDVQAYREKLAAFDIHPVTAERFVVCDELKVAGTYDHTYSVPIDLLPEQARFARHDDSDRVEVMGDKKTGSLHFDQHAIQMAIYAHGEEYDAGTGERTSLNVLRSWALLAHIPAGKQKADLYWVDINAGWEATHLAIQVREWRNRKDLGVEVMKRESPAESWVSRIAVAATVDEARRLYTEAIAAGVDGDTILPACLRRKAELEEAA